jgi:predicted RNA-binding protein (TIGR00451 family)
MSSETAKPEELQKLRAMADYLFGSGTGLELFPDGVEVKKSKGRIRQIWFQGKPVCALRANDGMIVLNREGGKALHRALPFPRRRVVVEQGAAEFVARGRTVFCKHVVDADRSIRPGEEVLVVDKDDRLLAIGKALHSGREMIALKHGQAVRVRRGMGVQT